MKLIRLLLLICCLPLLNGCASLGKGMMEAVLEQKKEDTRLCQIKGKPFEGLFPMVKDPTKTAKVLMVHGVGTHIPGYSTQLLEGLSAEMKLDHISEITKNIEIKESTITDENPDPKKLGNLRITRSTNKDKSHELIFYELTWSEITNDQKRILTYDNSGEYSYRRAAINNVLKKFMNDTAPDPMLYLGDLQEAILISFAQSFCWMVSTKWDDLPVTTDQACDASQLLNAIEDMKKDRYAFISHSLGSRIVIDGLQRIVAKLSDKTNVKKNLIEGDKFIKTFQQLQFPIFMLSNQLPMLQLGRKLPDVTGERAAYCRADGAHYDLRRVSKASIIAFSDPNDILSYALPDGFIEQYIDSRLCAESTNININVAAVIDAFGIDMANPLEAHIAYETDDRVLAILTNGVGNENTSPLVNERCRILITD